MGNGTTIATLFARQGASIFGCDISLIAAGRAASQIRAEATSHEISVMYVDATSSASCKEVVDACMARCGRIGILVNNVGRSEPGGPAEMSEDVWDKQMDVSLKSVYRYCHLVLLMMEKQERGGTSLTFLLLPVFDTSVNRNFHILQAKLQTYSSPRLLQSFMHPRR